MRDHGDWSGLSYNRIGGDIRDYHPPMLRDEKVGDIGSDNVLAPRTKARR